MLPDLVEVYGSQKGRTIIFTDTKLEADFLLSKLPSSRVLHGDIP